VIDTATSGSGFSSKTILITSENRHQCPEEDEMTFCEGEICIDWICPHGTTEHDSCELDFEDEAYERKKYRTCSCHKLIGSIQIFSGCKWKRYKKKNYISETYLVYIFDQPVLT